MLEGVLAFIAEKLVVPVASWGTSKVGKAAPGWLARLKSFVRRTQLQSQVTDDEVSILRLLSGTQWDYATIERQLSGRFEGDELLVSVTKLETLGLLAPPRLSQPPHPDALFSVAGDASLLLRPQRPPAKFKPRKRHIPDAVTRRKRLAENRTWLEAYRVRSAEYAC